MAISTLSRAQDTSGADRISVLIVDDHPVLRFGVMNLLENEPDFDVIGTAGSCAEACRIVEDGRPDIVLLDLEMDDTHGADAPLRLREHGADKIIVFTAHKNDPWMLDAIQIGINGYIMKGAPNDRLCEAIRIVARGGMYLDPAVAPKITLLLSGRREQPRSPESLTERERDVLKCIAAGKRNREIAKKLFISERTVKFHASSVFAKLGATNRTEAVKIALERSLITYSLYIFTDLMSRAEYLISILSSSALI
jgi:DNA-binding NarL/FixJ family response regulator